MPTCTYFDLHNAANQRKETDFEQFQNFNPEFSIDTSDQFFRFPEFSQEFLIFQRFFLPFSHSFSWLFLFVYHYVGVCWRRRTEGNYPDSEFKNCLIGSDYCGPLCKFAKSIEPARYSFKETGKTKFQIFIRPLC